MKHLVPAVWGFLVGFVGWGSCFRLAQPVGDWLVPRESATDGTRALTRLVVLVFLIFANLFALAVVPASFATPLSAGEAAAGEQWRALFGTSFVSSLAGLAAYGLILRLGGRGKSSDRSGSQ